MLPILILFWATLVAGIALPKRHVHRHGCHTTSSGSSSGLASTSTARTSIPLTSLETPGSSSFVTPGISANATSVTDSTATPGSTLTTPSLTDTSTPSTSSTSLDTSVDSTPGSSSTSDAVTSTASATPPDPTESPDSSRLVFAHYMVGITYGQESSQWETDISQAKSAGIDGFALNIGTDPYTEDQLELAYDAASTAAGGFMLFLSFDMAASSWSADQVVELINRYKDHASQHKVDNVPFVSTFEGPFWDGWDEVRAGTGGIFFVPDWSSQGPAAVTARDDAIDGAFNWGAWPGPDQTDLTTDADIAYQSGLDEKPYMMGVSPYFYTNLPQYGKNWYSTSDTLWFTRWRQAISLQPEYVQIITWNDFGESSYINNPIEPQIVPGAETYVDGFDHSAFRSVLPYFIAAYKAGDAHIALESEVATAWYRTTSSTVCGDGGTVWGQGGRTSAASGTSDVISIIALSDSAGDVTVSIGDGESHTVSPSESFGKAHLYQVPFGEETGDVVITVDGRSTTGPAIVGACPASGHVNFNAVAINI